MALVVLSILEVLVHGSSGSCGSVGADVSDGIGSYFCTDNMLAFLVPLVVMVLSVPHFACQARM